MKSLNQEAFEKAYYQLNKDQKEAVDNIYGPVMAIAGPGTGKTQLLAVRVCNIIAKTDMAAQNVLCLTFTDAGAKAMRARLLSFMGPDAYHVGVHTYHSFCNQIIRENPDKFSEYRDLQNATDLEMVDIMTELIDTLPLDHQLKRLRGEIYYDIPKIRGLFETMKQEGWSSNDIIDAVQRHREELNDNPTYQYKINRKPYKIGDPNPNSIKKEMDKYIGIANAAPLISKYEDLLKTRDRIDYYDSILFVIKALKEDDMLLAYYQERFQFILADEYQDTNGTQNELLFLLSSYDLSPNLFVVGDDDQAIYRFQGANMNNIVEFRDTFKPKEVVLDKNYRSAQPILDAAMLLIDNNKERLAYRYKHLSKQLKESRQENNNQGAAPEILVYDSLQAQDVGIINKIKSLHQKGVSYKDIGIIYRKHKEVAEIVKYMTYNDIPINVKKKVDVLQLNDVKRITRILEFIYKEFKYPNSEETALFEILHYDFWGLRANEIAKISVHASRKTDEVKDDKRWRNIISDEKELEKAEVKDPGKFIAVSDVIEGWISKQNDVTIQVLFEMVLTQSGLLSSILSDADKTWRLQVINTYFNFIKEETAIKPDTSIAEIMMTIEKMKNHRLSIPISHVLSSLEGINFMTAHSSKGLEFDHVFIINVSEEMWMQENNSNSQFHYKYPPTLVNASGSSDDEDDRRLFYVALTRAKNHAYISYSSIGSTGKEQSQSRFFTEMGYESKINPALVNQELVDDYIATLMRYDQGEAQLIDKDYIDRIIDTLYMSATSISKYIKCKTTFYFENILRVPMARTNNMGYGNAIHYALEKFIETMNRDPKRSLPELAVLLRLFKKGMEKFKSHFTFDEYAASMYNGEQTLTRYYEERKSIWSIPRDMKTEYVIKTEYEGIPISGIIDRVDIHDHHIDITDYKTGSYSYPKLSKADETKEKNPEGGDYWRQVVFYKMLIINDKRSNWQLKEAIMDFVQPKDDKIKDKKFSGEDFDIQMVGKQLKSTYEGIKQYDFSPGCNEPDCKWCNFVKENMSLESPLAGGLEEEDHEYSIGD